VRFVSTCRHLAEFGASAGAACLWETFALDFVALGRRRTEQFAEWCASKAGRCLRRLQLLVPFTPGEAFLQQEAARISTAIFDSLAGGGAGRGPQGGAALISLHCLSGWPAERCFAAVLQLKQLKQLVTETSGQAPRRLQLPRELSALSALTSLKLNYTTCTFPRGCLPSSLRALQAGLASPVLPPALLAATQLESLQLSLERGADAPLNLAGVEQLTRLTFLALHVCQLQQLPPQLLALTALRALDLVGNPGLHDASLLPLTALPALRELDLCHCNLDGLPAELLNLGRLEVSSHAPNGASLLLLPVLRLWRAMC